MNDFLIFVFKIGGKIRDRVVRIYFFVSSPLTRLILVPEMFMYLASMMMTSSYTYLFVSDDIDFCLDDIFFNFWGLLNQNAYSSDEVKEVKVEFCLTTISGKNIEFFSFPAKISE